MGPIDAIRVLRGRGFDQIDEALESLLAGDEEDRSLARGLGSKKPVRGAQEFGAAHRRLARALEIPERLSGEVPEGLLLGPIQNAGDALPDPTKSIVVAATVLLVIGWIVAPAIIALLTALL